MKTKIIVYPGGKAEVYLGDRLFFAGIIGKSIQLETAINTFFLDKKTRKSYLD